MSQSKKRRTEQKAVEKEAVSKSPSGKWTRFTVVGVVIIIILIIIGISLYPTQIAPFRRTVISVDGITIRMDYFLKRTELSGGDAMTMLDALTREQIIKIQAPRIGITVSPEDIDQALKAAAGGASGNITESEFREWYRQQLNESRLSDAEFKELVHTSLLAARLHEYLAQRVPTIGEQVHVYAILVAKYDEALKIRERWAAGEDFTDLAREVSMLATPKEGGELGWFPQGVLLANLDYVAFTLDIGQVSDPIPYLSDPSATETEAVYYLVMVTEKAVAREIDGDSLNILKSKALDNWLGEEMQFHDIKYNFNSEINAWINWQLAKRSPTKQQQESSQQQ